MLVSVKAQFHNSNFEFSGVEYFWNIVDAYQNKGEPSPNEWERLFNSPGYKVLIRSEFTKEFLKTKFEQVCKDYINLNNVKISARDRYYLTHYKKVLENRQNLQFQINKLKSASYNQQAVNKALNYLPIKQVNEYPQVSFVIFANDGRGYSPIVIDLLATMDWDFVPFLAHEYHHWYRNKLDKVQWHRIESDDRLIMEVLSQLEAEGIADQIDKSQWDGKSVKQGTLERNYIAMVNQSPSVLEKVDKLFSEIASSNDKRVANYTKIKSAIPQGGHPTGFFMATMILKTLGRSELVRTVGNPIRFIKTFNNAARMKGKSGLAFSFEAMKVIEELERKYILE